MIKLTLVLLIATIALSTSGCLVQRTVTDSDGYTTSRELVVTEPISETLLNVSD